MNSQTSKILSASALASVCVALTLPSIGNAKTYYVEQTARPAPVIINHHYGIPVQVGVVASPVVQQQTTTTTTTTTYPHPYTQVTNTTQVYQYPTTGYAQQPVSYCTTNRSRNYSHIDGLNERSYQSTCVAAPQPQGYYQQGYDQGYQQYYPQRYHQQQQQHHHHRQPQRPVSYPVPVYTQPSVQISLPIPPVVFQVRL